MAAVTYRGIDEIIRGFGVLPREVAVTVRRALDPVWRDMKGALASYPAERPGQRYKRTGNLGRGWTEARPAYVVKADGGIDARITNPVSYTDQVQGDAQMIWFKGRWTLASTIVTEFEGDITIAVERGCVAAIRAAGLQS
jgi:hypothetical protein